MKFNENTIELNFSDINRIALYMVDSYIHKKSVGAMDSAQLALEEFKKFYNYLDSRGYYDDIKTN